jgi:uncharacterized protein (UPF0305 family)
MEKHILIESVECNIYERGIEKIENIREIREMKENINKKENHISELSKGIDNMLDMIVDLKKESYSFEQLALIDSLICTYGVEVAFQNMHRIKTDPKKISMGIN